MNVVRDLLADDLRAAAFRRLLARGAELDPVELATELSRPVVAINDRLREFSRRGCIRLDNQGRVIGSAGLSVVPDRHRIVLDGRQFWTWCAFDVVGIFGALGATGTAYSTSPTSGAALEVAFHGGQPEARQVVLFRPDERLREDCCSNVYEEWCPNSNFFEDADSAWRWARENDLTGTVLGLAEATDLGARSWAPLCT